MCEFTPILRNELEVDVIDYQRGVGVFFKGKCVLRMTYDETIDLITSLMTVASSTKGEKK